MSMRQAFVLKLGAETDVERNHFVGCIEEVDTGRELRFKSTYELLAFLAQCFERAKQSEPEVDEPCGNE
jgi:hypothetical protein